MESDVRLQLSLSIYLSALPISYAKISKHKSNNKTEMPQLMKPWSLLPPWRKLMQWFFSFVWPQKKINSF